FQADAGIRGRTVTGVQTCALPILLGAVFGDPGQRLVRGAARYMIRKNGAPYQTLTRITENRAQYGSLSQATSLPPSWAISQLKEIGRAPCREKQAGRAVPERPREK